MTSNDNISFDLANKLRRYNYFMTDYAISNNSLKIYIKLKVNDILMFVANTNIIVYIVDITINKVIGGSTMYVITNNN